MNAKHTESATAGGLYEKMFLEISQNSQENTLERLLLMNLYTKEKYTFLEKN